jgi:hypothetical protein
MIKDTPKHYVYDNGFSRGIVCMIMDTPRHYVYDNGYSEALFV